MMTTFKNSHEFYNRIVYKSLVKITTGMQIKRATKNGPKSV